MVVGVSRVPVGDRLPDVPAIRGEDDPPTCLDRCCSAVRLMVITTAVARSAIESFAEHERRRSRVHD